MPYSTLHAMMCCHTNKSNLVLLPFLFSVLCPYIQLFFSVVYILECYVTFSLSCFFETLVSRCFRDLFIILLLLLLLLLLLFHERTEMHEIVWPTTKKKKKRKKKRETPELGTSTSTVSLLLLPITNLRPREHPVPTLLCARKIEINRKRERKMKKKEKKRKEKKKKQPYVIIMKNNIFWFILGSRSAPFLSLSFEENIYFWR